MTTTTTTETNGITSLASIKDDELTTVNQSGSAGEAHLKRDESADMTPVTAENGAVGEGRARDGNSEFLCGVIEGKTCDVDKWLEHRLR